MQAWKESEERWREGSVIRFIPDWPQQSNKTLRIAPPQQPHLKTQIIHGPTHFRPRAHPQKTHPSGPQLYSHLKKQATDLPPLPREHPLKNYFASQGGNKQIVEGELMVGGVSGSGGGVN